MRYVITRYQREQRELAYRIFVTDGIKMVTENTARASGGSYMSQRYFDVINTKHDDRTAEEIAIDTIIKAQLSFKGSE